MTQALVQHPIELLTCPSCQRRYGKATEQAVAIEEHGICAGCILVGLDPPAREREQFYGYRAVECPDCAMIFEPACPTCDGGRIAYELLDGSGYIDIRQPKT